MEIGEDPYSIVISCEGAKVKAVYDAKERYENLKFSDSVHKEMWDQIDQMKTWPSGQAFGSVDKEYNGFMLYNYEGNSCLISRYELSGLNENDWLGYVDIFFDYDAKGQVRILDLGFYPRTS